MAAGLESAEGRTRDSRLTPLILTLVGLYAPGDTHWLPVAALVDLMADLDVDGQAVRKAVSRLKRRGVLRAEQRDGAAGYALEAPARELLAEDEVRIFQRFRAQEGDSWLLVVFSVPESEREKRHELRASLTRLGFGTVAPGIWIAPGRLAEGTRRILQRRGLSEYAELFVGDHFGFGDVRSSIRQWWDLDWLTGLYATFLDRYRPEAARFTTAEISPREAFGVYLPLLTDLRQMPYRDPGLPLTLLPPGWNGVTAGDLFQRLDGLLSAPAREHALSIIRG